MRSTWRALAVLVTTAVAALVFVGCSGPPAGTSAGVSNKTASVGGPSADAASLRVRVLLDSARADPTFTIDDGDGIGVLAQLFGEAKPDPGAASGQTVSPSTPGYKGILIENPHGEGALPRRMTVYKDRLQARDGAGGERFFTVGPAFESFLVDQGVRSKALDDKAVEQIRSASGGAEAKPY